MDKCLQASGSQLPEGRKSPLQTTVTAIHTDNLGDGTEGLERLRSRRLTKKAMGLYLKPIRREAQNV